jgi:hypothetical protein
LGCCETGAWSRSNGVDTERTSPGVPAAHLLDECLEAFFSHWKRANNATPSGTVC